MIEALRIIEYGYNIHMIEIDHEHISIDTIDDYKKALLVNPRDFNLYNNIGVVYKIKKDYKKAVYYYKKAMRNPNK